MSDVKWIKIVTGIFDDEKILLIESMPAADAIIVIWFKLLCLAGKQNNSGVITMSNGIPYTEKMLSVVFRRDESVIALALQVFQQFKMVEIIDDAITIPNWGKHQTLDKLEQKTEYMKGYMRDYRAKQRLKIAASKDETSKTNSKTNSKNSKTNSKANVSSAEEDVDVDKEDKKDSDGKEKDDEEKAPKRSKTRATAAAKPFVPPTLDEVIAYANGRESISDPRHFWEHYDLSNWTDAGGNSIINWKQKFIQWESRDRKNGVAPKKSGAINPFLKDMFVDEGENIIEGDCFEYDGDGSSKTNGND